MQQKCLNYQSMYNKGEDQTSKLEFATALTKYKALGMLPKTSLPEWNQLSEYKCQMVIDQYQNQDGQIVQQCRLEFVHLKAGNTFSINIIDLNYVKNTSYFLEWSKKPQEESNVSLGDQIGYCMTVNCLNFKKPYLFHSYRPEIKNSESRQLENFQEFFKKNLYTDPPVKEQYSKRSTSIRNQPVKKEEQLLEFDTIRHSQTERSDFGSDIEQEIVQPKKKLVVQNPIQKVRMFNEYRAYQQRNLIDYSQTTKVSIRFKLLQFFKIPQNRKMKIPQIREFLRKNNYNVPQKPLKQLIKDLCVSNVMDRVKGYMLKDIYLSQQELQQRQEEKLRLAAERIEQQKKKRSKRQPKVQAISEFIHEKQSQATTNMNDRGGASRKKKAGKQKMMI